MLITAAGAAVAGTAAYYQPYGNYRTTPTTTLTERGYTGHHENRDIGLTYMNARYYIPGLGRFLTADTIVPSPTNPQSHNRYSYVLGNPLVLVDPRGHYPCFNAGPNEHCLDDPPPPVPGRVASAPIGPNASNDRIDLALDFIKRIGNYDWLLAELDFENWIYESGRLASPWWNAVNGYLLMSRFAALAIVEQGLDPTTLDLAPGVAEWIDFIHNPTEQNFWRAHNAALREGVRRADAAGFREMETTSEQEVIQTVLNNVYRIGDSCANGSSLTCWVTNQHTLKAGTVLYPHHYPALPTYAATMPRVGLLMVPDLIFWHFVTFAAPCNRSFTACEGP